ncbi:hypothetical protein [Candidatus Bodocaedibacter vickermanii]|uniref:Uncharacterized protein n=1 Tax=Candidatus Bodocaedibacter vickermanii TaxID=2741701 RepID=A0A7L9RSL9_9PROT|nr:hypothetical protein CPBP_00374 [Candidatus Paracaedibacteraceae bacterium 'Lake Konstanz']
MKKLLLTLAIAGSLGNSAFGAAAAVATADELNPTATSPSAAVAMTAEDTQWLKSGVVGRSIKEALTADDLARLERLFGIKTLDPMARVLMILSNSLIERTYTEIDSALNAVEIPGYSPGDLDGFLPDQQAGYILTLENIKKTLKRVKESEPRAALHLAQAEEMVLRLGWESDVNFERREIARFLSLIKLPEHSSNLEALMACILADELCNSEVTDSFLPK